MSTQIEKSAPDEARKNVIHAAVAVAPPLTSDAIRRLRAALQTETVESEKRPA